mmetsp:Transcript_8772/g.19603  ORF Transcript_8772/g.19603 Transcript_8772/m.19603 type:complete len:603 (+) Transcript_8772:90-1898(+)
MSAEDDLTKIAHYFNGKYGSLQKALEVFEEAAEFDLAGFEVALKRWGIKVSDVADLFDHIDIDWSGRVSVQELFAALQQPMEDIRDREQLRRQTELAKMYRELARRLRSKFQSIDAAIEQLLKGKQQLSLTDFRKLVNEVNLELSSTQLRRIFEDADDNKDDEISVTELKDKTGVYIVQDVLTEMVKSLTDRCGSISTAFAEVGLDAKQVASDRTPTSAPEAHMLLEEDAFMRLLRQLRVAHQLDEASAVDVYRSLAPKTLANFQGVLERIHDGQVKRAQQHRTEFKRRVQELQKKKEAEEQHAASAVAAWMEQASTQAFAVQAEKVTQPWELAARKGRARTQLTEYITLLEEQLQATQEQVANTKAEVEQLRESTMWKDGSEEASPLSIAPSPSPPVLGRAVSTISAMDFPLPQRPVAERAQQLLQAVAEGNTSTVQRLIGLRADVNICAWGGVTPIMAAAHHGRVAVLSLLLSRRADLRKTDMRGRTALDHALRQPEAKDWLRARGALGGKELLAEVAEVARRVQACQAEMKQLERRKQDLPSRGLANRFRILAEQPRFFPDGMDLASNSSPRASRPGPMPLLEGVRPRLGHTTLVQPMR